MKLLELVFSLAFILLFQTTQAQETYYPFTFKELDGLTDSLSKEIIKPTYYDYRISKNKQIYVFGNELFSDSNVLYFDTKTGIYNTKHKYIFLDDVVLNDQSYHYFSDKKSFLQNSETAEIVKTKEDIYSIENLGSRYIVSKFHSTKAEETPSKPLVKDKNGLYLPPKSSLIYTTYFAFYSNSLPLNTLLKIEADEYLELYETNEIDAVYMDNIRKFNSNDFDYLLFKKENKLQLYDKNLKLIKIINYLKDKADKQLDKDFATAEVSKILSKPVYHFFLIYPTMGNSGNSERKREDFEVVKSPEGLYQFIRTSDEKVCFTSPLKMDYYDSMKRVEIEDKDKKRNFFIINKETGMPYFPAKYLVLLDIVIKS